jgi:DNA polymerase-3 subunit epsilon
MKVLWLDTETTGLDPEKNGLIEIAGLVEIDGEVREEFVINSGLFGDDVISEGAAELQGLSVDDFAKRINEYQAPRDAYVYLKMKLDWYIDRFNPDDKFTVAGYNVSFDVAFLEAFFRKMGDSYLYSYIRRPVIDILAVCRYLSWAGLLDVKKHNLETVCEAFNIELKAHTALEDIRATRAIALEVKSLFDVSDEDCRLIELLQKRGDL